MIDIDIKPESQIYGGSKAATVVAGDSAWHRVATINTKNITKLSITSIIGGTGPLTGYRVTAAAIPGGTHNPRLSGTDFNVPGTFLFLSYSTSNPHQAVTGAIIQHDISLPGSIAEVGVEMQSAVGATGAVEAQGAP